MANKKELAQLAINLFENIDQANQFDVYDMFEHCDRIVCKATSIAKANQIAESLGFMSKVFRPDYTSVTGNLKEIEMCDKRGVIINISRIGENYIPFSDLVEGDENENP